MEIILIRHGDAESHSDSDFNRNLTAKGKKQISQLANYLKELKLIPDRIISSPVKRAAQTADILNRELKAAAFYEDDTLSCGMSPEEACQLMRSECSNDNLVILVGHAPDMGYLAAYLTGMESAGIEAKKGCCIILESGIPGRASAGLRGMVAPWMMKPFK